VTSSLSDQPTTFELVGARVVSRRFTGIIITLYRPGSAAVLQSFFNELTAVLDRVAIYQEPVYVVGDYNIRLDRPDDPRTLSSFVNSSSRMGCCSTTRARRINLAARSTLWSHEPTLAVQNKSTSSTSVCPTIICCGSQLMLPARLLPLPSRTVEPGGVCGLRRFPGYAGFVEALPAEQLAR